MCVGVCVSGRQANHVCPFHVHMMLGVLYLNVCQALKLCSILVMKGNRRLIRFT